MAHNGFIQNSDTILKVLYKTVWEIFVLHHHTLHPSFNPHKLGDAYSVASPNTVSLTPLTTQTITRTHAQVNITLMSQ